MSDTAVEVDDFHDAFLVEEVAGGGWQHSRHNPSVAPVIVANDGYDRLLWPSCTCSWDKVLAARQPAPAARPLFPLSGMRAQDRRCPDGAIAPGPRQPTPLSRGRVPDRGTISRDRLLPGHGQGPGRGRFDTVAWALGRLPPDTTAAELPSAVGLPGGRSNPCERTGAANLRMRATASRGSAGQSIRVRPPRQQGCSCSFRQSEGENKWIPRFSGAPGDAVRGLGSACASEPHRPGGGRPRRAGRWPRQSHHGSLRWRRVEDVTLNSQRRKDDRAEGDGTSVLDTASGDGFPSRGLQDPGCTAAGASLSSTRIVVPVPEPSLSALILPPDPITKFAVE